MGQKSEDGNPRTQARPRFLGEDMAGTVYRPDRDIVHLQSGRGSDDRSGLKFCP